MYVETYCNTSLQRFISEDPSGFGGGSVNLFRYADANPVMLIDPLGLCAQNQVVASMPWFPEKTEWEDVRGPFDETTNVQATFSDMTGPIGRTDWKVIGSFEQERRVTEQRLNIEIKPIRVYIQDGSTTQQNRIIERVLEGNIYVKPSATR